MNIFYTLFIYPVTGLIELVFTFSQKVFKEPGISILAIGAAVNVLCLPLYNIAEKWRENERNAVKKLKPKINRIKSVFSGDERFMILQTFYRQNHYHPLYALRSSFGFLVQIPFFIAAYSYLSGLEILNGASFLFIPDLGAPDRLFPLWGINILPLAMTAANLLSGTLYTKGFPLRDKIQLYGMAVFFLVLLYNSPSGLVLYWTMNNLFSLAKNIYYKLPLRNKKKLLFLFLSALAFFVSFYLLKAHRGAIRLRILIAAFFAGLGVFPWIYFLFNKILTEKKKPLFSGFALGPDFPLFLASLGSLWVLAGLFIPSMLIGSSPEEFSFLDNYTTPLFFIAHTGLQAAGLVVLWPLFLYFLFGEKVKKTFTLWGSLALICSGINIFMFPGNYGVISLDLVFDSGVNHNIREIMINFLFLALGILFILILFWRKGRKLLFTGSLFCFAALSVFSSYNLGRINKEFQKTKSFHFPSAKGNEDAKPVFHFSKTGNNTVILMLDRAVSVFIPFIFEEDSALKDIYSGFIFYPNTAAFNGYTCVGSPPLFGGYEYTPLEINRRDSVSLVSKHNEALLLLPRIFSEAGCAVTITDPPYPNYSAKEDLRIYDPYPEIKTYITDSRFTETWLRENNLSFPSTSDTIKRNLLWYSLFRISPLALRQGIYLQGDWCAPALTQKMTLTLNGYVVLDYLPKFTDFNPGKENTVLIMVNNTTHEASFLQAPDYRPVSVVTDYGKSPFAKEAAYHVNAAAIKRLGDWFKFLKAEGVYDNTRIILVSDHGPQPNFCIKSSLPINIEQYNALLMVKDFGCSGPLETDFIFMSNADVPFLALEGQIENPVNPFTGKEITTDMKANPLYIAVSGSIQLGDPNAPGFLLEPKYDYYVHDNIFDENNWEKAGE